MRGLELRHEDVFPPPSVHRAGSALSRNRATASFRLSRALSIEVPWLATSSSGHSATYRSPSRSMIAVNTDPVEGFFTSPVYMAIPHREPPCEAGA